MSNPYIIRSVEMRDLLEKRRACWVVLVRVHEKADWCAYGPMTHTEALEFRRTSVGTGIERQIAQLIKCPSHTAAEGEPSKGKS
jgi:hypothetical protein